MRFTPVEFELDHRQVLIAFMPTEVDHFDRALEHIKASLTPDLDEIWIAQLDVFDKIKAAMKATEKAYKIRALGTVLDKMAEIVLAELSEDEHVEAA